jgi:hypothetical protein
MRARALAVGAVLVCAGLPVSACAEVESAAVEGYEPAHLKEVKGSDVPLVAFTKEGAERTDLKTAPVVRRGAREVIPYQSLIYDAEGKTWVYTATGALTFQRTEVIVDRIMDDERVVLTDGPPAGTDVVTVGAAEVYGAELEVAGSH